MPILKDARGNEFLGSLDAITNQTLTDARTIGSVLALANAEVVMDLNGHAVAVFDLRAPAAMTATIVFEGTVDGVNYFSLPGFDVSNEQMTAAVVLAAATLARTYVVGVSGFRRVRCRLSAHTSGSVTCAARASQSDFAIYARPMPSTLHVTVTAAANAGATITLPAPGAGLFHYITQLECMRHATAALAGTATLIVTSTNLPGTPAWSVGNAMAAGGQSRDVDWRPTTPLKSLTANTATTIVMPAAGAAVLWRGNCSYYVGA